jgi:hypothetical protein
MVETALLGLRAAVKDARCPKRPSDYASFNMTSRLLARHHDVNRIPVRLGSPAIVASCRPLLAPCHYSTSSGRGDM